MATDKNEAARAAERKEQRELQEARQAGTAAPEVDVNSGKMINPHNPAFVTQRPWYLGESGPSLNHHVARKDREVSMAEADAAVAVARSKKMSQTASSSSGLPAFVEVGTWIEALYQGKTPWLPARVEKVRLDGKLDVSFENGKKSQRVPQSHVKLPKALGGARAEAARLGKLSWDGKRDSWQGYDASMHQETVRRYEEMEAERARLREAERAAKEQGTEKALGSKKRKKGDDTDSDSDDSDAESQYGDEGFELREDQQQDFQRRIARQGGLGGAQMKTTVRNLRIREDTAKYLRNLDPNSAYYDPKSRAMRENPTPNVDPKDLLYAGDNFARATGDALELAATQVFAWDVERKGAQAGGDVIHLQAEPSRTELLRKDFAAKKADLNRQVRDSVLAKYGDASTKVEDETPDERRLRSFASQSEAYREYTSDGRLAKGAPIPAAKSKYSEDIYVNNHTAVWGSYFCTRSFRWGYADDQSLVKNSYSTGEKGKRANQAAASLSVAATSQGRPLLPPRDKDPSKRQKFTSASQLYGLPDPKEVDKLDEAKVAQALERQRRANVGTNATGYNSLTSTEVTLEEMEAYRRSKLDAADPMASFMKAATDASHEQPPR